MVDFLAHASAAIERVDHSLAKLHSECDSRMESMSRVQRNLVKENLLTLERYHSNVMDAYREMERSSPDALPQRWHQFLDRYDDYLGAIGSTKADFISDNDEDERSPSRQSS